MRPLVLLVANDWRLMRRSPVAPVALVLLIGLVLVASLTALAHHAHTDDMRARLQAQVDQEFDGQPSRHPHRMVHYGHFVFRPLPALAAFDPGVDAFTGNVIYLEGHRQNSANFSDVRQSSLLARFGHLTPAFIFQVLAPLVLIFIGFGTVATERQAGTLQALRAQGVSAQAVIAGKMLALGSLAGVMLLPAVLLLAGLVLWNGALPAASAALVAGYGAYLVLWVAAVVAVSALARSARTALILLLSAWTVTTILVPRIAPDIALAAQPLPTRVETDIAIQNDLRRIGDSHNPDDPHFSAFKARVLNDYGAARVEDLPVNFRGLLAIEGEKLTSQLFDTYAAKQFHQQQQQGRIAAAFALASPAVALKSLSMALAGTDLDGHRRFLMQAEAYRFEIVQQLNRLQAEAITFADDEARNRDPGAARRVRIDPHHWHDVPDFRYRPATFAQTLQAAGPGLGFLLLWTLAAAGGLWIAARRLAAAG